MQLLRADVFYAVKKDIKRLFAQVHLHQRLIRLVLSDQVEEEYPIPGVVLEVLLETQTAEFKLTDAIRKGHRHIRSLFQDLGVHLTLKEEDVQWGAIDLLVVWVGLQVLEEREKTEADAQLKGAVNRQITEVKESDRGVGVEVIRKANKTKELQTWKTAVQQPQQTISLQLELTE